MNADRRWMESVQAAAPVQAEPPPVFLPRKEVERRVGLGRSSIYQRMANKTFPEPVHDLDTGSVWWLEHEIVAWQTKRIEARMGTCMGRKEEGPGN